MWEYYMTLTRFFQYKGKIVDFIPMWEKTGRRKPVFSHILCNAAQSCKVTKFKKELVFDRPQPLSL